MDAEGGQTVVMEKATIIEKKQQEHAKMMKKMNTTSSAKKVKTDAENSRRPILNNSPVVKRLNTKTRAKHPPLKKPTNQSKEISLFKKKNFIEIWKERCSKTGKKVKIWKLGPSKNYFSSLLNCT